MSTFTPLAVPVARAPDGSLARPRQANPELPYTCAGCGAPLVLRRSGVRRAHFAHRGGDGCSTESVLHRAAKELVVRVVEEWVRAGGPRPAVSRSCPRWTCDGGVTQDLPDDITHARAEVRVPGGAIADVVLYRGETPAAAVEIVATHRVDREKAQGLGLPWVELDAQTLIDNPYWWVPVQDGLRPFACPKCQGRADALRDEAAEIDARARVVAERAGLQPPPSPPYGWVPHRCWRCTAEMVAYLWPAGGGHSAARPPEPVPETVRLCATEGYGAEYWANCCPECHAVQGDYHLRRANADYIRMTELMLELDA